MALAFSTKSAERTCSMIYGGELSKASVPEWVGVDYIPAEIEFQILRQQTLIGHDTALYSHLNGTMARQISTSFLLMDFILRQRLTHGTELLS